MLHSTDPVYSFRFLSLLLLSGSLLPQSFSNRYPELFHGLSIIVTTLAFAHSSHLHLRLQLALVYSRIKGLHNCFFFYKLFGKCHRSDRFKGNSRSYDAR
uniref:Putative secreted protein n=1 Tax=Anopheles darlingi TaxID=43151 RepID=A0A2M4DHT3_ANODA